MPEAMRDVYGRALKALALRNGKIVALDADLSGSTKSGMLLPELRERHFNVGIAEANMAAMAAGFASCGFIPFINTFATVAASSCMLALKSIAGYSSLEVRIAGSNIGLGGGYDGATHHCFDDLNVMRAIPGMKVLVPSDARMLEWAVGALGERLGGPAYMGVQRHPAEDIYSPDESFELGRAKRLRPGSDVAIIACGAETARALRAAERLEELGISAAVVDMFAIKPLDREAVEEAALGCGAIVTAEEHSIIGGLGSAVAETLAELGVGAALRRVGIRDRYTQSGSYGELVELYSLDGGAIAAAAIEALKTKKGVRR